MTKLKAFISITVAVSSIAVAVLWSPSYADARWAVQEGEQLKLPLSSSVPSIAIDGVDLEECREIPAIAELSIVSYENEGAQIQGKTVSGRITWEALVDEDLAQMDVVWWWCYQTKCRWVYLGDDGWQRVCTEVRKKCYISHSHPHN